MLDKRRYQTLIGYTNMPWQKASGWLFMTLLSATMVTSFLPGRAYAQSLGPASLDPQSQPSTTPAANSPLIIPSPSQGPVKTLVTLQGTDWPPESQVLLSYDNDPGCSGPNLTELSPDPKPTANSAGRFSASFSWPTVSETGSWYICAETPDHVATATAVFNVLSLSPPSLTLLTKGPFMPGQAITVQGQNWLPGGLYISFALQPVQSTASFPLEETAISLFNGTFEPISITIPLYLTAGSYILVATMEQQALEAHSSAITIEASQTPTPTATPSPSPPPLISATATPIIGNQHPPSTPRRLSGTMLALVIISGSMALAFALIGGTLLMYLMRKRAHSPVSSSAGTYDEIGHVRPKSSD